MQSLQKYTKYNTMYTIQKQEYILTVKHEIIIIN